MKKSARRWRGRFQHVLVDEFQDTDPLQIDILWRLCGEASKDGGAVLSNGRFVPGRLFLVGDPKQAIYRFRGADVNAYIGARTAIGDDALLKITANFRSVEPILTFVNDKFETVLSTVAGQPGFTELSPTCDGAAGHGRRRRTRRRGRRRRDAPTMMRDAEAKSVADLCSRLVGNRWSGDGTGRCGRADWAISPSWRLSEPTFGDSKWRSRTSGIAVSTQAGKGFFRRQEIQDLIALTRTLADGRDTLALGALLRGSAGRVDRSRVARHRRSPPDRSGPS